MADTAGMADIPDVVEPIHYIDRSDIREGRLAEVRAGMRDLADFIEAREPQLA
ncbi:hypothetical protein ACIHIX_12070 [Streptomyces sp. NPDC051913]|uniref:hypothetical protein n=1 Tax=Streptomyces sp. NPDC051913 TaxID=3365676 RepID=UPI0037CFB69A